MAGRSHERTALVGLSTTNNSALAPVTPVEMLTWPLLVGVYVKENEVPAGGTRAVKMPSAVPSVSANSDAAAKVGPFVLSGTSSQDTVVPTSTAASIDSQATAPGKSSYPYRLECRSRKPRCLGLQRQPHVSPDKKQEERYVPTTTVSTAVSYPTEIVAVPWKVACAVKANDSSAP